MTQGQSIFDERGRLSYELDFEGYRITSYVYQGDSNVLEMKIDCYGNKTHYNDKGQMLYTENKDGVVLQNYIYKYDDKGNYILDSAHDPYTQSVTYFDKDGRQTVTKNWAGAVIQEFFYQGSKLIATFSNESQMTTWYRRDGKALYTTFNNEIVSKNLYYNGQLVGVWNAQTNQVEVYENERRALVLQLGDPGHALTDITDIDVYTDGTSNFYFRRSSVEAGIVQIPNGFKYSETVKGYVLQELKDENGNSLGNVIQYDPILEPTAADIKAWIDAGLIDEAKLAFSAI